jgi:hypothetical protein
MSEQGFDLQTFIDREEEYTAFQEILSLFDTTRILALGDKSGAGKTYLLARLRIHCRTTSPSVPVSFIELGNLRPLDLVWAIKEDLARKGPLRLERFTRLYSLGAAGDYSAFLAMVNQAQINLEGADFTSASDPKIATYMQNFDSAQIQTLLVNVNQSELSPLQRELVDDFCINVFFEELRDQCADQPAVILLDAFEKASPDLKDWIVSCLLERFFFDSSRPPPNVVLVLAGQQLPSFEQEWPPNQVDRTLKRIRRLGQWEREHIETCLQQHGIDRQSAKFEQIIALTENMLPIHIIQFAQLIRATEEVPQS